MKNGLPCVAASKNCSGEQCENVAQLSLTELGYDDLDVESDVEDLVPDDCMQFDIPWLDEEVIEWE